ncbi:MAG: hypothetical protein ACLFWM_03335 [Actinomycetota bacterium]
MTLLQERPVREPTQMPTRSRVAEVTIGIIGLVAAAVGAWMYYVPTDWFLGGVAEGWYLGMFTGAGLVLAVAFGLAAFRAYRAERAWTAGAVVSTVLGIAALAGAVAFGIIWLI